MPTTMIDAPSTVACSSRPFAPAWEESELVRRLRRGCTEAFGEVVRTQTRPLLAVARRLVGNEADARDVVQETFGAAFRGISSFAGESLLSTWLHRIVVNVSLMHLRRRRRRPEESIEDAFPHFERKGPPASSAASCSPTMEERLDGRRTREMVRRSIERLPETHRRILILRDIEDLNTVQTAEALGITTNAAKIRLHRARQALRALIEEEQLGRGDGMTSGAAGAGPEWPQPLRLSASA